MGSITILNNKKTKGNNEKKYISKTT